MRHALEEPGVVHDDHQPLRDHLAVRAAELGHVGVHGQLLARQQDVGVGDGRLDDRPIEQPAGRFEQRLVVQERLDAGDESSSP